MIRIERDPAFWLAIASHPAVAPTLLGLPPEMVAMSMVSEHVLPVAAIHGGFFFTRLDPNGRLWEFHTLFTPDGWGREALMAAKEATALMFRGPCQVLSTYQIEANPRSQPPRTFGFIPAGPFVETPFGASRTWILTRNAWEQSPAHRSGQKCPQLS